MYLYLQTSIMWDYLNADVVVNICPYNIIKNTIKHVELYITRG